MAIVGDKLSAHGLVPWPLWVTNFRLMDCAVAIVGDKLSAHGLVPWPLWMALILD